MYVIKFNLQTQQQNYNVMCTMLVTHQWITKHIQKYRRILRCTLLHASL